jgi:tRNA pseudouridine38-40 synthase
MGERSKTLYLKLFYDGTKYFGWSKQPGLPSVQSALENSLSRIGCRCFTTKCYSRTDAKVSALSQLVKLVCKETVFLKALNSVLPEDIAVTHFSKRVGEVTEKNYVYVYPSRWNHPELIKSAASQISVPPLCERFFKKGGAPPAASCRIDMQSLSGSELVFFSSKGFGYQQIRRIMGVFESLDKGEVSVNELKSLDPGKIRAAEPDGLVLLRVEADAEWVELEEGLQKARRHLQRLVAKAAWVHSKWVATLFFFEQQH